MTKNPFVNAFAALLYIEVVANIMFYGPKNAPQVNGVILPIAFLSLFVLSAAIMGYIFFYNPAALYLEGSKKEAVNLFLKTVLYFAAITIILLIAVVLI